MKFSKLKLVLALMAAVPAMAFAAADQEAAMKDANNWAHPRGQHNNQAYSALAQINKANVKNV
jgi:glucose dehydrogenase